MDSYLVANPDNGGQKTNAEVRINMTDQIDTHLS